MTIPIYSEYEFLFVIQAVMEFIKRGRGPNFTEADIETVNSYLVWGAVGLHYANQFARWDFLIPP